LERLVSTSKAAEILGLSLQGIHYRIKKNHLRSIKQDGKIFVYLNESLIQNNNLQNTQNDPNFDKLLEAKDEQIIGLKKSIKWMKNQHSLEMQRLEKNQEKIIEVFNSEIKLLQSAFNEMRAVYKPQIENKTSKKSEFIKIKEFFMIFKRANKSEDEIKDIIFKAIKNGDERFIYNKKDKKLLILNTDFSDLI